MTHDTALRHTRGGALRVGPAPGPAPDPGRLTSIWGSALRHPAVGPAIRRDVLPTAPAERRDRALPEPLVTGHGLQAVPEALDLRRRGLSAQTVVVTR